MLRPATASHVAVTRRPCAALGTSFMQVRTLPSLLLCACLGSGVHQDNPTCVPRGTTALPQAPLLGEGTLRGCDSAAPSRVDARRHRESSAVRTGGREGEVESVADRAAVCKQLEVGRRAPLERERVEDVVEHLAREHTAAHRVARRRAVVARRAVAAATATLANTAAVSAAVGGPQRAVHFVRRVVGRAATVVRRVWPAVRRLERRAERRQLQLRQLQVVQQPVLRPVAKLRQQVPRRPLAVGAADATLGGDDVVDREQRLRPRLVRAAARRRQLHGRLAALAAAPPARSDVGELRRRST
mmetsp:Transcript_80299/g.240549  ORF Transcript_80299/g.240549 Transcript_80299/m.240549 type:complete len:301 (-) Transcript_80299:9-911(-)